jgi:hypothetical protein
MITSNSSDTFQKRRKNEKATDAAFKWRKKRKNEGRAASGLCY